MGPFPILWLLKKVLMKLQDSFSPLANSSREVILLHHLTPRRTAHLSTKKQDLTLLLGKVVPWWLESLISVIWPYHAKDHHLVLPLIRVISSSFIYLFLISGLHLWHMEVPRLGVESEPQLQASATATATSDSCHICDLHHSCGNTKSLTHWARLAIQPVSSQILCWVLNLLSHNGNSSFSSS